MDEIVLDLRRWDAEKKIEIMSKFKKFNYLSIGVF